jgi:hypothetical protein
MLCFPYFGLGRFIIVASALRNKLATLLLQEHKTIPEVETKGYDA